MPINLTNTGCLANVNVSEFINGVSTNSTYSGIASLSCIPFIIQNIIFWLLVFAGTVALILVIIAGIKFITSGGDAKQAEGARKTLTFAILGLVLILFSFAILRFIAQTTGLDCITKFGFSQCIDYTPKEAEGKRSEINCDPNKYIIDCSAGENRCKCVDKPRGCKGNERKEPVCDPNDENRCECVPKDWPKCNSLIANCGPGYKCKGFESGNGECKKIGCDSYNDCSNNQACESKKCVSCDKAKIYLSPCGDNYVCKDKICQYDSGI